jgi:hypothetical protein
MQLSPFPCHNVPLRSKYSPQHPILKHTQPAFDPQCRRPTHLYLTCNWWRSDLKTLIDIVVT